MGDIDGQSILRIVLTLVTLVLSVCVHEFAHAWAATKLGDDLPEREGRLTLNPLAHADPLGTLLLPGMMMLLGGFTFGWGKPVNYNPNRLTRKYTMRACEAMISVAGPLANLLMGTLSAALLIGLYRYGLISPHSAFWVLLQEMIPLNFVLFIFNLFPVPPLDGARVLAWIVGPRADPTLDALRRARSLALMLAFMVGGPVASFFVRPMMRAVALAMQAALT